MIVGRGDYTMGMAYLKGAVME